MSSIDHEHQPGQITCPRCEGSHKSTLRNLLDALKTAEGEARHLSFMEKGDTKPSRLRQLVFQRLARQCEGERVMIEEWGEWKVYDTGEGMTDGLT